MEGVVENFSVVDSMPMISEEPESAGHIIATVTNKDSNGQQITIINDVESTIKSRKSGSMEEQTHTIHAAKSEEQIIPEAMTQIITTSEGTHIIAADGGHEHQSPQIITASDGSQIFAHKDGHIISTDTGQIMTHEISNDGQIFTNSGGELITDETSHIIMNDGSITTDGRGNILHAGGQVITENGKAHILSADGEVIAVDSSLLEGAHDLQEHVTEVRCME